MEKCEVDKIIEKYAKILFGFAMSKLLNLDEAEELASEIILTVYSTLLNRDGIVNVDGYIYKIAYNVYARFINKKHNCVSVDGIDDISDYMDFTDDIIDNEEARLLRREITYLSDCQRKIVILHYYHDMKIGDISKKLGISHNTVKWYLSCSRKELYKGMEKEKTIGTLGLEPVKFINMGHDGHPGEKGDTCDFLSKSLSQNIAYAAYHKPKTINEIAEELGVNPIFVRDEVNYLEEYGFMEKLPKAKYRTNILITEQSSETKTAIHELSKKYSSVFAETYFKPYLEKLINIPDCIQVPDNDVNLLKWALITFMANKLATAEISDFKYSVKRKDGGDYVAFAEVDTDEKVNFDSSIYSFCGPMWRNLFSEESRLNWRGWQMNTSFDSRTVCWNDNLHSDYENLYYFIKGELPQTSVNVGVYKRLLDKGYLIKENGSFKLNVIVVQNSDDWSKLVPPITEELLELSKRYAKESCALNLLNQPEHVHEIIRYYSQNSACALHTYIMKELLDMNILKQPTSDQAKGLCTILFMDK